MNISRAGAGKPTLARPWVHIFTPYEQARVPWDLPEHKAYSQNLWRRGVHGFEPLVLETLHKLKSPVPQVAFCGVSNVGKSTLINALINMLHVPEERTERKKLTLPTRAPTSSKPGRTRHLFRFEVGGRLTLVDLPGYGIASAPKSMVASWEALIDGYLTQALNLQRVVSLIDAREGPSKKDEQLWEMVQHREQQLMVVLTKVDGLHPRVLDQTMLRLISSLQALDKAFLWPYVHAISALDGLGMEDMRGALGLVASDYERKKDLT